MFEVLVTRKVPREGMERLMETCGVTEMESGGDGGRQLVMRNLHGKDAVITFVSDHVDSEFLDAAGDSLQIVSNYGAGIDNVNVQACSERGVLVCNTPDVVTEATADMTWALLLGCARRVVEGDRLMRSGHAWQWDPSQLLGVDVHGKTLGVVGLGRIGQAVCRRASGFGVRVVAYARSSRAGGQVDLGDQTVDLLSLEELLACSDYVSLHVSLSEATRHLIDNRSLRLMKRGAILVNTSRGPVVEEEAVIAALEEGRLGGVALDVFEYEPHVAEALIRNERTVLTPHLGSATVAARRAMTSVAAENVMQVMEGQLPTTAVNPEVWGGRLKK